MLKGYGLRTYPDTSDEAFKATILTALARRDTNEVDVSAFQKSEQDADAIYQGLLKQHPELFDVDATLHGETDQSTGKLLTVTPTYYLNSYSYTDDQVLALRDKMARGIADAMSWIPADGTPLEKVKAAHDWMCTHVSYYSDPLNVVGEPHANESTAYGMMQDYYDVFYTRCAYGAFGESSCVAQGFANAYKLLMDKLGIPCVTIDNAAFDNDNQRCVAALQSDGRYRIRVQGIRAYELAEESYWHPVATNSATFNPERSVF